MKSLLFEPDSPELRSGIGTQAEDFNWHNNMAIFFIKIKSEVGNNSCMMEFIEKMNS